MFSSEVSLAYTLPAEGVIALAIQPYVRFNWSPYDITPLYSLLTNNVINQSEPLLENFATYGISIVVYNGQQR